MTKILTLGNGFIANELPYNKILDRINADSNQIINVLNKYKPDILVNCLGFCGNPNIDQCVELKSKTFLANTTIPTLIAYEAEKLGIRFINISSGCIFSGKSPNIQMHSLLVEGALPYEVDTGWKESDPANPPSYYSKTKYSTDLAIGDLENTTCLRIRMPFSSTPSPRNIINKLITYNKVLNELNSMTWTQDLSRCIDWVIKNNLIGIYNVVNPKPLTAVDIIKSYQINVNTKHRFKSISVSELDCITKEKRSNCLLDISKLEKTGFEMTNSKKALEICMKEYYEYIR